MKRKSPSTTSKLWPVLAIVLILGIWELLCVSGAVPSFMLPSPIATVQALVKDASLLASHATITVSETVVGLLCGILVGFVTAVVMDRFDPLYQGFYPLIVLSQTIPTVAIAPLLVLWFGYGMLPKVVLIVVATFFPITVSLLSGFRGVDADTVNLLRTMGASQYQIFWHVKFPSSLSQFFSSLRISTSYAMVAAVISEWLGGYNGLGVYMTRVKKSFSFDKMFAVIFLISTLSLLLMALVSLIQKKSMPWENKK